MQDIFTRMAEMKIREAVEKGELNNLPGRGKPLELEKPNPFEAPEERVFNKLFKNLGLVPVEVSLLKEMENLRQQLAECNDAVKRRNLKERLRETTMKYNIKMEARKRLKS